MKKYRVGNSFQESFNFVNENPDWNIIHCISINNKTKLPMIHAYAQKGLMCRDIDSDGKEVFIPSIVYEAIGNISKKVKYSIIEYIEIMLKHEKDEVSVYGCYTKEFCRIENESRSKMRDMGLDIEDEDYSYLGDIYE
ncbi:MAG: hypothetical protein ACPG9K_00990 [Poseidonibacter sp.]